MNTAKIPFRRRTVAAMVQLALVGSGAAWAQSTPQPPAAPAEPAAADGDRIVITATKRLTSVQDTPLAVSAFSMRELDKAQVKDLSSMQALVPNLTVEQHGDSGGVHVFLRGIGSTNHTEIGDPAVAFHVDGV